MTSTSSNYRKAPVPYTMQRAKTQPSKTRVHPGRLTKQELFELLEDDNDD
jgi:ribosome assembly protein YihI (activator of Der GTPase)